MDSGGRLIGTVSSALSIQKRGATGRGASETSHPDEEREPPPHLPWESACLEWVWEGQDFSGREVLYSQHTERNKDSVCLCVETGFNCVFFVQMLLLISTS